jgi:hypothetical protein
MGDVNWGFKNGPDDIFVASGVGQGSFVAEEAYSVAGKEILQRDGVGQFLVFLAGISDVVKLFDMTEGNILFVLQLQNIILNIINFNLSNYSIIFELFKHQSGFPGQLNRRCVWWHSRNSHIFYSSGQCEPRQRI